MLRPRGSSPPPTASGGNQTRPGGQNPTRAAKRPQLEQRDTAKKAAQGPRRLFWRTRAAQAWHPQNRALRGANFSTTALPSTGGGQFHDRQSRKLSLVASGRVELQETTQLRNRKESHSLNDLFRCDPSAGGKNKSRAFVREAFAPVLGRNYQAHGSVGPRAGAAAFLSGRPGPG